MELVVEGDSKSSTIRLRGELVATEVAAFKDAVLRVGEQRPELIILDFAGVSFIDSPGLGALVGLRGSLRKEGILLSLKDPQERVLGVLRLTQLHRLFDLPD